jgi:hypothetical protein
VYRNYACVLKNQVVDTNKKRHADTHDRDKIQYKKRYQFDEAVKNYFVLPHQWNEPIVTLTQEIQSKDKSLSGCQIDNDNNSFNNLNFKTINENESMANLKQKSLDGNVIIKFISNRDDLLNEFQLQRENMSKMEKKFLKLEEVTVYPLVIRELKKQSRV